MFLVQVLLPLHDNHGRAHGPEPFRTTERELVERYGGVTTYIRSPARGKWAPEEGEVVQDEIVICEVMAEELDRAWWSAHRAKLARRFAQEELVVRASSFESL